MPKKKTVEKPLVRWTNAAELLELLKSDGPCHPVPKEIEVAGQKMLFHIQHLSYRDTICVEAKKYIRRADGTLVPNVEHAETVGVAWLIHECVMYDANEGQIDEHQQPLPPDWVRMFSLKDILGDGERGEVDENALMCTSNPNGAELIDALRQAIYQVNPECDPAKQLAALEKVGLA